MSEQIAHLNVQFNIKRNGGHLDKQSELIYSSCDCKQNTERIHVKVFIFNTSV